MTSNALSDAITAASIADVAFAEAARAAGYKTRWDFSVIPVSCQALRDAYFAKVDADKRMHDAFVQARQG